MNLQEIKDAVNSGKTVCWKNGLYQVKKSIFASGNEQWNIICSSNNNCIGLTWADGVTLNGEENEFFIAK